jgi:hypothetical protein
MVYSSSNYFWWLIKRRRYIESKAKPIIFDDFTSSSPADPVYNNPFDSLTSALKEQPPPVLPESVYYSSLIE